MSSLAVATITSTDSGGTGTCNTPPTPLGRPLGGVSKVYAGKTACVANGDSFRAVSGTTPKGDPCQSTRTLKSLSKVKIGKKSIGRKNDVLNPSNNIRIAKASEAKVFAG